MVTAAPSHPASARPVLFLMLGSESYGIRRVWLELMDGFTARGVPVRVALVERGELAEVCAGRGVPCDIAPLGPASTPVVFGGGLGKAAALMRRARLHARLLRWLNRLAQETRARAIVLQSPLEVPLVAVAAKMAGIPAYWMLPNTVSADYPLDFNRVLYRLCFKHLNVVPLANSRHTDASLGPGRFERHVVYLGVDPADFDPDGSTNLTRAALGIPGDVALFGVFARMVEEKGQRLLIEAMIRLGDRIGDLHLLLCGGPLDTDYVAGIRALLDEHGLADRVHFTGPVEDVAAYYRLCDVTVNSRLDPEPFGLSVVEGMMMARPALVHQLGGPGETVIDGVTGWHIARPDLDSFCEGLGRAITARPHWPEMGAAARRHALANFTSGKMTDDLLAVMGAR